MATNQLGITAGPTGRMVRLMIGICVILWVLVDFYPVTHVHTYKFFLLMAASFVALVVAFSMLHLLLGRFLEGRSPVIGTLIFVVPMIYMLIAPEIDSGQQIGHWIGYPELNHPFRIGLLMFLGVSLIVQWFENHGGCEVVAIPNFLFKRQYGTYCLPLLVIDVVENKAKSPDSDQTKLRHIDRDN